MTKPAAEVTFGAVDENLFRFEAVVVRFLLALPEWSQARLAAESGIDQSQISLFQRGKRTPSPEDLEQLAQAAGWPLTFVEKLATTVVRVRGLRSSIPPPLGFEAVSADVMYRVALEVEAGMAEIGRLIWADAQRRKRAPRGNPAASDHEPADDLWSRLADLDAKDRRMLVEFSPVFHLWSLAVRLADESERAAAQGANDPGRRLEAVELAQLSLDIAERCQVPPSFLACLKAYALGHLAHARRFAGEAKAAETFWQEAWTLWRDDDPHTAELLPKARLINLESALLPGDWAH